MSASLSQIASDLRKAMKGFGTDDKKVIAALQRYIEGDLFAAYKFETGRNLIKDLKSELSGNFEVAACMKALLPAQRVAFMIHEAIHRLNCDEDSLIMAICTMEDRDAVFQAYQQLFELDMRADVYKEVKGNPVLVQTFSSIFAIKRGCNVSPEFLDSQVERLEESPDLEPVWTEICALYTPEHHVELSKRYAERTGRSLVSQIDHVFDGDAELCLTTLVSDPDRMWGDYAIRGTRKLINTFAIHNTVGTSERLEEKEGVTLKGRMSDKVGDDALGVFGLN